jgi:hypothetical protein
VRRGRGVVNAQRSECRSRIALAMKRNFDMVCEVTGCTLHICDAPRGRP